MPNTQVRGRGTRRDTYRVSLTVAGEDWGVWDAKTGGAVTDGSNPPWPSGGMGPAISLGGQSKTENITLSRLATLEDDIARMGRLINGVGKAKGTIKQSALDVDGNAFATQLVQTGTLTRFLPPEPDASSVDGATLEVEFVMDGVPVAQG